LRDSSLSVVVKVGLEALEQFCQFSDVPRNDVVGRGVRAVLGDVVVWYPGGHC
jgi:hypothetical protein